LAPSNKLDGIQVKLYIDLVTPPWLKIHFLPCSFKIDLKHMNIDLADGNSVYWNDLAENVDDKTIFPRNIGKC